ncbi:MAG: polymer-forming cytoskeletal protein [Rubrivivax sp.]
MMQFGRRKSPPIRSLIGEGTLVQGPIRFTEGLRIDGEVQGDVIAAAEGQALLVVSDKAKVTGMVKAAHVIINGQVIGPVEAGVMLELQPLARVTGQVRYELLEMHPGALIDGELRPLKNAERPALKLAASNEQ